MVVYFQQIGNVQSSWSEQKIPPHKICGKYSQQSSYLLNVVIKKQSTCFIYIIYPGKYNGTVLLTHEACTKQLE